jgi:hypothetical protein
MAFRLEIWEKPSLEKEVHMNSRSHSTLKSILLLAGSFTFAFLFGEMVHEFGHALGHLAYGSPGIKVYLDPFGYSHIGGADGLPNTVSAVTAATGPLFDLFLALICSLSLWRFRKPILLPLLIWGPVAMVQEGVTFSLGLLTPGGDARWITALGIPPGVILAAGILLLLAGVVAISQLLPLAGIEPEDSFGRKFMIIVIGMGSLMLIRFVVSSLALNEISMENLIPLVFSLLLASIVVSIQQPVARMIGKKMLIESPPFNWPAWMVALILGASVFTFQILAFN